jgi:hypothetical protein
VPSRNALVAPSVDEAVRNAFGMQPNMNRLNLLPRYNEKDGLVAPNALYQLARALVSPGVAAQGGYVSPEDGMNFAGNFVGAGVGAGGVAPVGGMVAGMGARSKPTASAIWAKFNDPDTRMTPHSLLREISEIEDLPKEIQKAARRYEKVLKTDQEWYGRYDTEAEEQEFVDMVGRFHNGNSAKAPATVTASYRAMVSADLQRAVERFGANSEQAKFYQDWLNKIQ